MKTKSIVGNDASMRLLNGVAELSTAVGSTMGPHGRNVLLHRLNSKPHLTKDGVTVAKAVNPTGFVETMAATIVKEVAENTAKEAGDGTTTATVLTHALLKNGIITLEDSNINVVDHNRGLKEIANYAMDKLKEVAIPLDITSEKLHAIAEVSANGDIPLADTVVEAIQMSGEDGMITVTMGTSEVDVIEHNEGLSLETGLYDKRFYNTINDLEIILEDPTIITIAGEIDSIDALINSIPNHESLRATEPVVVFAYDYSEDVVNKLLTMRNNGGPRIIPLKMPGYGSNKAVYKSDIDTYIRNDVSRTVLITQDTVFIKTTEVPSDVSALIAKLKDNFKTEVDGFKKSLLEKRIASLAGSMVTIKVGGVNEVAAVERKDRIDDAVAAVNAAVSEGIVCGGGTALLKIDYDDFDISEFSISKKAGVDTFFASYIAPAYHIASNAGLDVVKYIEISKDNERGINAFDGDKVESLIDDGIIDPVKVTRVALKNAVEAACSLLTTKVVVIPAEEAPVIH